MQRPIIGMLCWEAAKIPRGLVQLATLPGNSTHPETFPFPIRYERIAGACFETVVRDPSDQIFDRMVAAIAAMANDGIRAVTTSCGFNAVFQQRLAATATIPVFTSSLLQVPTAAAMIGPSRTVGIMTANQSALTDAHLRSAGIEASISVRIAGIEATKQWRLFHDDAKAEIDLLAVEDEILEVVETLARENNNIGAIVLECTDLPPFAGAIRRATGLPVFDIVTLTEWVYRAAGGSPLLPTGE